MPCPTPSSRATRFGRIGHRALLGLWLIIGFGPGPGVGSAQSQDPPAIPAFQGPAPPALPATIARDTEGRMTVRAVRLDAPLEIDGRLDERIYSELEPISDFIQMEPAGGAPASERTEVWLLFDADNIYVTMRAWESQ